MSTPVRVATAGLLTVVALLILVTMVPAESFLRKKLSRLEYVKTAVGLDQNWNMFTTVANHHSSGLLIQSMDEEGTIHSFGPILPGLERYDESRTFRFHTAFNRFLTPSYSSYVQPWSEKVARELEDQGLVERRQLKSFGLELRHDSISYLKTIRDGGEMTYRQIYSRGPWNLNETNE